jgi:hypothetical protein
MTYTDEQVAQYFAENPGLSENQIAQVMRETGVSPEQVARVTQADPGYVSQRYNQYLGLVDQARVPTSEVSSNVTVAPQPEPYVDTVAQNLLGRLDQEMDAAMVSGDYANVANVMKEAEGLYGPATYTTVADYLNTNPRYEGLRGQVGGAAYTPENLQSFVSSIPAPVDPGIAGAVPTGPAGALPAGPAGPGSTAASPSRVYQPTYTSYRQEGQAPFGGYYTQPGISPYGGVFGVGTEQFAQQSDPFSGAQARARSLISNRLTPLTDNIPIDARQPGAFGGDVAANGVAPSPFAYRQTLSPNTLAALAAEATSEAAASEAPMRRGGYIDQGIAAVRR